MYVWAVRTFRSQRRGRESGLVGAFEQIDALALAVFRKEDGKLRGRTLCMCACIIYTCCGCFFYVKLIYLCKVTMHFRYCMYVCMYIMLYTISDSMLSCWKFFLLIISWSESWLSCRPFENISVPLPTYISYIHTLEKEGTIANISISMHAMHVCVIHCPMHCFGWVA